ncbi:MAG: hypothetical protein G8D24_01525 [Buchnera aphidicola (Periphyllus lyropictus)]|nr:hypothetical protein [Buchnera aphidicola (Periphyllus lyropictus)]
MNTGIYFFYHILKKISVHFSIYMNIRSLGGLNVDDHHTLEDIDIVLGKYLFKFLKK